MDLRFCPACWEPIIRRPVVVVLILTLVLSLIGLLVCPLVGRDVVPFCIGCLGVLWVVGIIHIVRGQVKAKRIRKGIEEILAEGTKVTLPDGKVVDAIEFAVTWNRIHCSPIEDLVNETMPNPLKGTIEVIIATIVAVILLWAKLGRLAYTSDIMNWKNLVPIAVGWCLFVYGCCWCYSRAIKAWGRKRVQRIVASLGVVVFVGCAIAFAYWTHLYSSR